MEVKAGGSYNGVRINGKDTNGWYQCRSMNGGQYTVSKLKFISCSLASPMCLYYQACGRPPLRGRETHVRVLGQQQWFTTNETPSFFHYCVNVGLQLLCTS